MIRRQKKKYGWEFKFLGANIEAVKTAASFGIDKAQTVKYHCGSEDVQLNDDVMSDVIIKL